MPVKKALTETMKNFYKSDDRIKILCSSKSTYLTEQLSKPHSYINVPKI